MNTNTQDFYQLLCVAIAVSTAGAFFVCYWIERLERKAARGRK